MEFLLRGVHALFEGVGFVLEAGRLGFDGFGFGLLALAHQPANFPGEVVALGEHLVEFGLNAPARRVQVQDAVDGGRGIDVAFGQGGQHAVSLLTEALKGQHG